jgi:hypothetical protein
MAFSFIALFYIIFVTFFIVLYILIVVYFLLLCNVFFNINVLIVMCVPFCVLSHCVVLCIVDG